MTTAPKPLLTVQFQAAANLQPAGEVGPSAPVANSSSAAPMTNNMPFDLAAGMADMSISGLPSASAAGNNSATATSPSNVPSGFDRMTSAGLHHQQQQPSSWAQNNASLPAQAWGGASGKAPAGAAPGAYNLGQAGSPYNSYYGFNPLNDQQNMYGSPDPAAFDPYRRDSAYGSGLTSPSVDMNLLGSAGAGAHASQARRGGGAAAGPGGAAAGGWSDRSPTRTPNNSFNPAMSGRGAAASGYPGQMFPSPAAAAAAAAQMQSSFYNPAVSMGQRGLSYQGQAAGRMGAAGYPEQLDYSAYGGTPYAGAMANFADPYRGMPGASSYQDRSSRGMRSPLLEEFRANRHRRWDLSVRLTYDSIFFIFIVVLIDYPLQDLRGHIVEFSGDQLGSRHLQTKLDTASVEERRMSEFFFFFS